MTPRRRYLVAFLALGWLVLLGMLLFRGMDRGLGPLYRKAAGAFNEAVLKVSDREGRRIRSVRGENRREAVEARFPSLHRIEALRDPEGMLAGAYDGLFPHSFSGLVALEESLDALFPVLAFYQAWGDRSEHAFPRYMMETIDRLGSVPMVTWEPWVTEFDAALHPGVGPAEGREYRSLAAVAAGAYDFHLEAWAAGAAAFGRPFFLRFGHEMNDPYRYPWGPQHGNTAEDYIAAWRHVREVFRRSGAGQVLWVWSPHMAAPWFEFYYPGGEWVDWVGVTVLNYGDAAPWSRWWTFDQILRTAYPKLRDLGKPVMLAEFATIGPDDRAAEWYGEAFSDLGTTYPEVRMVVLFNQARDATLTSRPLDWSVLRSERLKRVVGEWLAGPAGQPVSRSAGR
jgi:hypothetical protein